MKQRQKIILLLTGLAVLYGAYELLLRGSARSVAGSPRQQVEEAKAFVKAMDGFLTVGDASVIDTYKISRAVTGWSEDLFMRSELPLRSKDEPESGQAEAEPVNLRFTGYLETADRRLAVINGREYEVGEHLGEGGYFLRSVSRTRATVGRRGDKISIALPLLEEGGRPAAKRKDSLPTREVTINVPALKDRE